MIILKKSSAKFSCTFLHGCNGPKLSTCEEEEKAWSPEILYFET